MPHVIDGYNLLHAMGVLHGRVGPTGLEKARLRLLGLLGGAHGKDAASVTVVFDAAGAPPGAPAEADFQGIHVRFARQAEEADDLIEDLIRHSSAPRQLIVVSDDHRLQQAARRRHCTALGCGAYLDWLESRRRPQARKTPGSGPKPERMSEAETRRWLEEFADLEQDADWKELSGPDHWFGAESDEPSA